MVILGLIVINQWPLIVTAMQLRRQWLSLVRRSQFWTISRKVSWYLLPANVDTTPILLFFISDGVHVWRRKRLQRVRMCAVGWLAAVHLNNHLIQNTVPRFTTTLGGHPSNSLSSQCRSVIVFAGRGRALWGWLMHRGHSSSGFASCPSVNKERELAVNA